MAWIMAATLAASAAIGAAKAQSEVRKKARDHGISEAAAEANRARQQDMLAAKAREAQQQQFSKCACGGENGSGACESKSEVT